MLFIDDDLDFQVRMSGAPRFNLRENFPTFDFGRVA